MVGIFRWLTRYPLHFQSILSTVPSRKNDRSLSRKKRSNLLFLTHHSKPSFFRDFFSRGTSHHFTVIILAGFFFHAKRKNPSFQWNYVFHRWKNNVSFLRCSTLLLLHRFLKLRAKGWRPQRLRCVVTYPAALGPWALCEWWAKPLAVMRHPFFMSRTQ